MSVLSDNLRATIGQMDIRFQDLCEDLRTALQNAASQIDRLEYENENLKELLRTEIAKTQEYP